MAEKMFPTKSVVIIVPAYNEEKLIATTLEGIPSFVDSIIVIDDASTDRTAEIVKGRMRVDKRITLVRHRKNGGVGKALASGYKEFLMGDADIAVVMNGDAQMDPASLPAIIAPLRSGEADYVYGNRFGLKQVIRRMPLYRLIGNVALSILVSIAARKALIDVSSGYTAITREALSSLDLDRLYPRYGVPIDLLLKLNRKRWRIKAVPVPTIYNCSISGIRAVPYARAIFRILRDNHGQKR